ncbi:hypothetical protein [Conexivisphaera calida]|uniref:Uncharacterized protein n=1 Tax=Conexivisphaera calida TaxID=1874277 RepID=A0A4P2VD26_9ARCH|nr:hypothetical protein [Conexivisphaera calida]BBE42037.1 hypothetical protein NAS2_0648 [Conexivisphaera calida]
MPLRPGVWTRVDRGSFEEAIEARMREVEARAEAAACAAPGLELMLVPFSRELRILPRELEDSLFLLMPRGPIYGFEAVAAAPGGGTVPLGAMVIVGIYDERSGEGVLVEDNWIDAQLMEVEDLLRTAADQRQRDAM